MKPRNQAINSRKRRGVALIITLGLLIVLTVMVVGFFSVMRTERQAAQFYDRESASQQIAQAGVMRVLAALKTAVPSSLGTTSYYVSMPGKLIGVTDAVATEGLLYSTGTSTADLNSFDAGGRAPIIAPNDFYALTGGVSGMSITAGWIPVLDPDGRLIGRFAYWTDDNACRVNINTAWRRSTPPAGGIINTSSIELRNTGTVGSIASITATLADSINSYAKPFHTPEQLKFVSGMTDAIYEANKFYITSFGQESNLDVFGRQRLNFNTLTMTDAGSFVHRELYVRLSNTESVTTPQGTVTTPAGDWSKIIPSATATASFLNKFPMGGRQLEANMIDFTKPRADACTMAPLVTNTGSTSYGMPMLNGVYSYLGIKKSIYLNEVIFNATGTYVPSGGRGIPAKYVGAIYVTYELVNPYDVDISNYQIIPSIVATVTFSSRPTPEVITITSPTLTATVPARSYGSITQVIPWQGTLSTTTENVEDIWFAIRSLRLLSTSTGDPNTGSWGAPSSVRDYISKEAFDTATTFTSYGGNALRLTFGVGVTISSPNPAKAESISKDDPRVPTLWRHSKLGISGGTVTPGYQNSGVFQTADANADGSEGGTVTQHSSFYIQEGAIPSLGHLGYVHAGPPWRTLRLQARPAGEATAVPDWVLLDIFKVSDSATITGRINVNSLIQVAGGTTPLRRAPIYALIGDIQTNTGILNNSTGSLTDAIINYTGGFSLAGAKGLAAEICEVTAMSNNGTTDAQKEYIMRQIAPLITTRSNSFTVWSIGQSIIDVNRNGVYDAGIDIISGESRVQAVIEILLNSSTVTNSSTPSFSIKYFRHVLE